MSKQEKLLAGYDYDRSVALPALTSEQEKQQFSHLPNELFQHLVQDRERKLNPQLFPLLVLSNLIFSELLTYERVR
jgi:hypothetical protein